MQHNYGFFEEDQLGKINDLSLWGRIMRYVVPQKKGLLGAVALSMMVIAANLTLPYLIKTAIDQYIMNDSLSSVERLEGIYSLASLFIFLLIGGFLANFLQVTVLEWTGQNIMHRLRQHLFSHMIYLDLSFFNNNPAGKLVTRLTNDIQNMHEMFTSVIITIFNDILQLLGILIILYMMNWKLAFVMSLLLPVIIFNSFVFSKLARDAFRSIRTEIAAINSFLQESISGIFLIQHFMREKDALADFKNRNTIYTQKALYQIKLFGVFLPIIEVISSAAIALIIWYGGGQVLQDGMSIGVLAAFLSYMRLFFKPVREISQKYSIVQSAMASAERIFEILDKESAIKVSSTPQLPRLEGEITFNEVDFAYNEKTVLRAFSLRIMAGETIAIVGSTGSGKTTIINLLERLYDPDAGLITIDGHNIVDFELSWLRNQIGLVIQDIFLIAGSFRDNLYFGREISDHDLKEIIHKSQLTEVIKQLPDSLQTAIGEGGYELSSGQKQLLALARVLVRDPKILVLDEATANIDSMTEELIEQAIKTILNNRTSIVIAHRLSTIKNADRILVVDKGRIIEQGTYQQLIDKQGYFYQLADQQSFKVA